MQIFPKIWSLFNSVDYLKFNVIEYFSFCSSQSKLYRIVWVLSHLKSWPIRCASSRLVEDKIFGVDISGEIVLARTLIVSPGRRAWSERKCPVCILSEWNSEDVPRARRRHCADRIHRVRIRVSRVPWNADIRTPADSRLGIFGAFQRTQFLTRHYDAAFAIDRSMWRQSN